jgi:hypothetical protein
MVIRKGKEAAVAQSRYYPNICMKKSKEVIK